MNKDRFIPVEGHSDLVRDRVTGAIVNINKEETKAIVTRKQREKQQQKEIQQLKNDVSDIKQMLQQIVEKI